MKSVVIGLTECGRKFENYVRWLEMSSRQCTTLRLSPVLKNQDRVGECDGIVMTGGGDLHPRWYGKPELAGMLDPAQVDERRDEFEMEVLEHVDRRGIPLLGICRGLQIVNVYRGGSLVADLPVGRSEGHPSRGGEDSVHTVHVVAGSMLQTITGSASGLVNSSHHQAADRVGNGLSICARSDDGVIEALESKEFQKGRQLLVQWHPERLEAANVFSSALRYGFLDLVRTFSSSH